MKAHRPIPIPTSLVLLFIFFIPFLFSACSNKQIDPDLLISVQADQVETDFPPSQEDLTYQKKYILPLFIDTEDSTKNKISELLKKSFFDFGDIYTIPDRLIRSTLQQENFSGFQKTNIPAALLLGEDLDATFVAQIRVTEPEPSKKPGQIDLSVFSVGTGQLAFRKMIPYNIKNQKKSAKALKKLIQSYFPIKGFILETRGNRQVAKISIGRSAGIKLNRIFYIHSRRIKSEIVSGVVRKTVTFSKNSIAEGTVIQVLENEAWLKIEKKDRKSVLKGQVVFAKPESSGMFE